MTCRYWTDVNEALRGDKCGECGPCRLADFAATVDEEWHIMHTGLKRAFADHKHPEYVRLISILNGWQDKAQGIDGMSGTDLTDRLRWQLDREIGLRKQLTERMEKVEREKNALTLNVTDALAKQEKAERESADFRQREPIFGPTYPSILQYAKESFAEEECFIQHPLSGTHVDHIPVFAAVLMWEVADREAERFDFMLDAMRSEVKQLKALLRRAQGWLGDEIIRQAPNFIEQTKLRKEITAALLGESGLQPDAYAVWRDWHQKEDAKGNTRSVEEVEAARAEADDETPPGHGDDVEPTW